MAGQIILETIAKHTNDRKVTESSQGRFMKRKSHLTNVVAFCDEITGCWMRGEQWLLLILILVWLLAPFPIAFL